VHGGDVMIKYLYSKALIITVLVLICSSCQSLNKDNHDEDGGMPRDLESFYSGVITAVDSIEIFSGDNGNIVSITDQTQIQQWIEKVKHLKIVLDPNREDTVGVLYSVKLMEKGDQKLSFSPTSINGERMETQNELADLIKELYEANL